MFRPILEYRLYAPAAWDPRGQNDIKIFERIQRQKRDRFHESAEEHPPSSELCKSVDQYRESTTKAATYRHYKESAQTR